MRFALAELGRLWVDVDEEPDDDDERAPASRRVRLNRTPPDAPRIDRRRV